MEQNTGHSSFIFDGTSENFNELVLDNSEKGPVLVNFWAPWVGPCFKLWADLEELVKEYQGKFLLVNVNSDFQKSLAQHYGITSLPTVKVFRRRKVVDQVYGAESVQSLRKLIDKYIVKQSDNELITALKYYQSGEIDKAFHLFEQAMLNDPDNLRISTTFAKLLLREKRYSEAENILKGLPQQAKEMPEINFLLAHIDFLQISATAPPEPDLKKAIADNPDNLDARYQFAAISLPQDNYESALQQLIEIIRRDRRYRNGAGMAGLKALFELLGKDNELTVCYRNEMGNILRSL